MSSTRQPKSGLYRDSAPASARLRARVWNGQPFAASLFEAIDDLDPEPTIDDLCERTGLTYGTTYRLPDVGEMNGDELMSVALYWPKVAP